MGEEQQCDLIILGGGLCGLYAGITACREGKSVVILEKEKVVGGLAAGFKFGENYCDFGVHMLHAFNQEIFEDCAQMMGEERIEVALDARIKWGYTLCKYPLKFRDMLGAMPPMTLLRCVLGLLIAELSRAKHDGDSETAEDALIAFYGAPLYEFFFEEFTRNYWGIHPNKLSAEFIRRKMPRLSAVDFLRKMLPKFGKRNPDVVESALDQETLHYSQSGAEALPRCLQREFVRLGGKLFTECDVHAVKLAEQSVQVSSSNGLWKFSYLLSTIPIHSFVSICEFASSEVIDAARFLKYKPTVVDAFLVKKERCMDGLYTYYRNRRFHRVGEPKNAGMSVRPDGHTLLIVEATCEIGDDAWEGNAEYREQIVRDLSREDLCEAEDIVDALHLRQAHGYPIYDLGFEQYLNTFTAWLENYPAIRSVGRQGAFTYPAMHTTMQMGKDAVRKLTDETV